MRFTSWLKTRAALRKCERLLAMDTLDANDLENLNSKLLTIVDLSLKQGKIGKKAGNTLDELIRIKIMTMEKKSKKLIEDLHKSESIYHFFAKSKFFSKKLNEESVTKTDLLITAELHQNKLANVESSLMHTAHQLHNHYKELADSWSLSRKVDVDDLRNTWKLLKEEQELLTTIESSLKKISSEVKKIIPQ